MSHSQFHSTNLFILRHAWLNLWDKHMTTGRINQVTISWTHDIAVRRSYSHWEMLSAAGVRYKAPFFKICLRSEPIHSLKTLSNCEAVLTNLRPAKETPCTPFSQVSDQLSSFLERRSRPSMKTTSDRTHLKGARSHGGSPNDYLRRF